jgi:UDP-N-acetylmuramate dehydrogenase
MVKDYQKRKLEGFFRGKLLYDTPLKGFCSFKAGGSTEVIAFPDDIDDLRGLYRFLQEEKMAFLVMGEGTNLLVRDGGFKGVVVKLAPGFTRVSLPETKGKQAYVKAQAGARLSRVLSFACEHGLAGMEFAGGIPGSVGGAVAMNAGAYGGEMKDIVASIRVLAADGSVQYLEREKLQFSYRKLHLAPGGVIVEAMFECARGDKGEIAARIEENLGKRKRSQPLDLPSAGSVFKNPQDHYAAQIIEELGLKGYQIGGAAVSECHANYIVNRGSATAKDIVGLITVIQEKVWQARGIRLEPEIRIVGEG